MAQSLDSDHMVAELLRAKLIARFFSRLLRTYGKGAEGEYIKAELITSTAVFLPIVISAPGCSL